MPLSLASLNHIYIIQRIGGQVEIKKHLEKLGFIIGGSIEVKVKTGGNLIVRVKDSRVAISEEMARKIIVS